jgi:hypothetical protein
VLREIDGGEHTVRHGYELGHRGRIKGTGITSSEECRSDSRVPIEVYFAQKSVLG